MGALALALAALLVALAATRAPTAGQAAAAGEPGQGPVLAALQASLMVEEPMADPAQRGVAGYLRAHGIAADPADSARRWHPAVRAILDYLDAVIT